MTQSDGCNVVIAVLQQVDVNHSGSLNQQEFISQQMCMRKLMEYPRLNMIVVCLWIHHQE
jgi:hypothetical protein